MKKNILWFILTFTLIACTSKRDLMNNQFILSEFMIDARIATLRIIDKRDDTTSRKLDIPAFSWPGDKDEVNPVLTIDDQALIENEVMNYFSGKGPLFNLTINVIEGKKRFSASWLNETEEAFFTIELIFSTPEMAMISTGNAYLFSASMDASHAFTDELYEKAIRMSINKALAFVKQQQLATFTDRNPIPDRDRKVQS